MDRLVPICPVYFLVLPLSTRISLLCKGVEGELVPSSIYPAHPEKSPVCRLWEILNPALRSLLEREVKKRQKLMTQKKTILSIICSSVPEPSERRGRCK